MPAFAFDTLKAARALTAAGMREPVAEAVVKTMNDAVTEGVATKADVGKLESNIAKLEGDIAGIKSDIAKVEADVANVKSDIGRLEGDVAKVNGRLDALKAEVSSVKWVLGFLVAVQILMAGRLFDAF